MLLWHEVEEKEKKREREKGKELPCKIISRRDSLEMGELCCLEFYVSTVRAHSFELLGRHKTLKKRDQGFVWSANKRRRRDRPRDAVLLLPTCCTRHREQIHGDIPSATMTMKETPQLDRNRVFVICLRRPKRLSRRWISFRDTGSLDRVHISEIC